MLGNKGKAIVGGVWALLLFMSVMVGVLALYGSMWWLAAFGGRLSLISSLLRDGVAIGDIGKPVGLALETGLILTRNLAVLGVCALVMRAYFRRERLKAADAACAHRTRIRAVALAHPMVDDMVDALERTHDLMIRGQHKEARHEIERALEAAS